MNKKLIEFEKNFKREDIPAFKTGDTIRVHLKIREGEKERIQVFEGTVIRKKGEGINSTFIVRKTSYGVGVERIIPVYSPHVEKIELISSGKVRRSRLYYLRSLRGKASKLKEKRDYGEETEQE
jgi:large subunit ribosomal protein L19